MTNQPTTTKEALEPPDRIWIESNDSNRYYRHPPKFSEGIEYSRVPAPIAPGVDDPEDVAWERQSTVNAIAYEFMKLFGATAKDGWTHDEMQPVFDAAREIITRTFPVLAELQPAPASTVAPQQSDEAMSGISRIATAPCREHEWGCANYGDDQSRWCVPCFARSIAAIIERCLAGGGESGPSDAS